MIIISMIMIMNLILMVILIIMMGMNTGYATVVRVGSQRVNSYGKCFDHPWINIRPIVVVIINIIIIIMI